MTVILTDETSLVTRYEFTVDVTNSPPRFAFTQPKNQILYFNNTKQYFLPFIIDDEGNEIEIITKSKPPFATLIGRLFIFSPN